MEDRKHKKSAFTLIELLIVTVVILALMGVMFRLTGIASGASDRETTVYRMQCLENCLSGYYAAFGSYPPVPLQGASRNIFRRTDKDNPWIQSDDQADIDDSDEAFSKYSSVEAACRSQPVAARYPPPSDMADPNDHNRMKSSHAIYADYQEQVKTALGDGLYSSDAETKVKNWVNRTIVDLSKEPGVLSGYENTTSANELQLFRFGLMSFLLPRYRFMLDCAKGSGEGNGTPQAFNRVVDSFKQWTEFNTLPPRMDSGISYASWEDFCNIMGSDDDWQIDLIPSQAACARWMPNLRDIVSGQGATFFGVYVGGGGGPTPTVANAASFSLYYPGGYGDSSTFRGYSLLSYTVKDGWGNDFYYYSPAPYQTYVLWSAGANGRTFPPWVDLEQFKNDHRKLYDTAIVWMADDIKYMSMGK